MDDEISKSLQALKSTPIKARLCQNDAEKEELIVKIGGPRTARSIRQALKSFSRDRIPFLFSSLDPQLVVDVLENDLDSILNTTLSQPSKSKRKV
jgi:hypothetical protein